MGPPKSTEDRCEDANMVKDGFDSKVLEADGSNGVYLLFEEERWEEASIPREGLDPAELEDDDDSKDFNDSPWHD